MVWGLSVISSMYQLTHGPSNFYFIREFSKQMDMDLPLHYWTLNERYSEDAYPSFDNRPDIDEDEDARNHPLRLHRLRINQRRQFNFCCGKGSSSCPSSTDNTPVIPQAWKLSCSST